MVDFRDPRGVLKFCFLIINNVAKTISYLLESCVLLCALGNSSIQMPASKMVICSLTSSFAPGAQQPQELTKVLKKF